MEVHIVINCVSFTVVSISARIPTKYKSRIVFGRDGWKGDVMNYHIRYHSERAYVDETLNHGCSSDLQMIRVGFWGLALCMRPNRCFAKKNGQTTSQYFRKYGTAYDDHTPLPLGKIMCGRIIRPWLWF
jgi:hypothetical protein